MATPTPTPEHLKSHGHEMAEIAHYETAHPHDNQLADSETRGIRRNRKHTFNLQFTGQELYDLRAILATRAVETEDFEKVRECVDFWETISAQAREQGF